MTDLTVLTVVENDKGTFDLLISSIYKFTDPVPNIIICNNGRNKKVLSKYEDDPNITIVNYTPSMSGGSNRHGEGLCKIFPMVKTSKTAIIESDCILLRKAWDYINPHHKIVAAPKGDGIYHICFMLFETELLKGIDFRPGKDGNRSNRSYKPKEDVGWQIGSRIKPGEIGVMDFKDCKTGAGLYFDERFQSDELWIGCQATVAHFGRGSNIGGKAIRKGFKHPAEQLAEWKKVAEEILR